MTPNYSMGLLLLYSPEIPTTFTKDLRDVEVPEQDTIILECELSKKGKPVKWLKDGVEIVPGGRIEVIYDRFCHQLIIEDATLEDMGKYSCVCGDVSTSATVTVEGDIYIFNGLSLRICWPIPFCVRSQIRPQVHHFRVQKLVLLVWLDRF